jgi:hypothetical protein
MYGVVTVCVAHVDNEVADFADERKRSSQAYTPDGRAESFRRLRCTNT